MPSDPRVSKRISISWSGAPPAEDTETIVLNTGSYYLDLRVFIEGERKGEIDWAAVGEVEERFSESGGDPIINFIPLVTSRPPQPAHVPILPDEGSFTILPNGDVKEVGVMFNLDTVSNEPYEEVWRRLELNEEPTGGKCVLLLESADGGPRTFFGRIGQYAMWISHDPSGKFPQPPQRHRVPGIAAMSWVKAEPGMWEKTFSSSEAEGEGQFEEVERLKQGDQIIWGNRRWKVIVSDAHLI